MHRDTHTHTHTYAIHATHTHAHTHYIHKQYTHTFYTRTQMHPDMNVCIMLITKRHLSETSYKIALL